MKALHGVKILNTRATHRAASLTKLIEKRGGISIEIPLISIAEPENIEARNRQIHRIYDSHWIIFTSVNSFQFTVEAMINEGISVSEILTRKKIAVVGSKTKAVVEKEGYKVELYPSIYDAEHLAEKLIAHSEKEETFFYPRSNLSRKVLVKRLEAAERDVDEMVAYETKISKQYQGQLNDLIHENSLDVAILTSPSAVCAFFEQLNDKNRAYVKESLTIAVIGRVTEEALSRYDVDNVLVPETFTLEAVISLIEENTYRF